MTDLTLHHRISMVPGAPMAPCIWCGQPTAVMALTPVRPDLGRLPLMLTCGVWMRDAYRMWQAGQTLPPDFQAGMVRLSKLPPPAIASGE